MGAVSWYLARRFSNHAEVGERGFSVHKDHTAGYKVIQALGSCFMEDRGMTTKTVQSRSNLKVFQILMIIGEVVDEAAVVVDAAMCICGDAQY